MPASPTRAGGAPGSHKAGFHSLLYFLELTTSNSLLQSHIPLLQRSLSHFLRSTDSPIEKCLELLSSSSTSRTTWPLIQPLASLKRIASSKPLKRFYRQLGPSPTPMETAAVHSLFLFSTKSLRMMELW